MEAWPGHQKMKRMSQVSKTLESTLSTVAGVIMVHLEVVKHGRGGARPSSFCIGVRLSL